MLVFDYIMGQQDRPGNIHYYDMLFYSEDGLSWNKIKAKKADKDGAHKTARYQYVIKEMILKDNDCGVVKGNATKKKSLLKSLRHISPKTYANILKFSDAWERKPELIGPHLKKEWLFTDADVKTVMGDLLSLRDHLQQACRRGDLKLDLDVSRHYSGAPIPETCDLAVTALAQN